MEACPFGGGQHDARLLLFGSVALAEAAVGVLLWRGVRAGAIWSLALLPGEVAFWVAFALPFPPLFAAVRLVLTFVAWSRSTRDGRPPG